MDAAYAIAVAADEPHERMRDDLVCLVEEFGSVHAEKSKLLHGLSYEIMATFGIMTSIDAAAVERFAQGLRIAKQTRLLNRVFEQNIRYTLAAVASSVIRSVELPKPLPSLFAQCQVTKPRTPTLKVRRIVSERIRRTCAVVTAARQSTRCASHPACCSGKVRFAELAAGKATSEDRGGSGLV